MASDQNTKLLHERIAQCGLSEVLKERHFDHSFLKKVSKGTTLIQQGDLVSNLSVLLSGTAQIYQICSNGKKLVLNYVQPGSFLGEVEIIHGQQAMAFVEMETDGEVLSIPAGYCKTVLFNDLAFLKEVSRQLAGTLYKIEINSVINVSLSLEERVSGYILSIQKEGFFQFDLKTLPFIFGTTYRHLLRVLKKLKEDQLIIPERNGYRIIDMEALKSQCYDVFIT